MNYGLFKTEKPKKAVRVARVECLNRDKGIFSSLRVSMNQKKYAVVLCLADKTKETVFHSEGLALDQMKKYRMLYKEKR